MLTEVRAAVNARGLKRVALLGTRFTIETRMFGSSRWHRNGHASKPGEIDRIHDIYKDFVEGRGSDAQADELRELARTFVTRDGAESVLIAGTDLSTVFTESNAGFPMLDCARIHIDAIVQRLLAKPEASV